MEKICVNCHWYKLKPQRLSTITCLEHFDFHEPTDTCDSFCENGKYIPTGIWANIATVVERVASEIEELEANHKQGRVNSEGE